MNHLTEYLKEEQLFWDHELNPTEDMLCEMANLSSKATGLDFVVWVQCHSEGSGNGRHNMPRLKVRNTERQFVPVSIEDEPKLLGGCTLKTAGITSRQFKDLRGWIQLNKQALVDYWNEKIEGVDELLLQLKKNLKTHNTSVDVSGRERTWEVSGVNLASNLIQTSVPNGWVKVDAFKDVLLQTVENGGTVTATEPKY